ncbi:MAG: secondary thiamine-phosphate synthase enzyme YjbQ [Planctomycetota bacterium]|jgi:secondary thiamine-phosphate synthase enzyme
MHQALAFRTAGQGLYEITREVVDAIPRDVVDGQCCVFVRHTSASLVIQENADPTARHDLERWIRRLVPEGDPLYTHTSEGRDDMPAHVKSALTATSLTIPVVDGSLALGTWQGIYLWEHRTAPHARQVLVSVVG